MVAIQYLLSDEIAPRRRLVSVSAAPHWPTIGIDALVVVDVAPRWRLVPVSSAPHWPTRDDDDILVLVGGGVDVIKDFATGDIALPPLRLLQTSVHFFPSGESASQGSRSESSSSESHSGTGRSSSQLSCL